MGSKRSSSARRFGTKLLETISRSGVIGIRAGRQPHRVIAVWTVVVDGRVFVRPWRISKGGWYDVFRAERSGTIHVGTTVRKVRALFPRSEAMKRSVNVAYREKYHTPGSLRYVRDLCAKRCRDATTELSPA